MVDVGKRWNVEERLGKVDVEASVFTCDPSLLDD